MDDKRKQSQDLLQPTTKEAYIEGMLNRRPGINNIPSGVFTDILQRSLKKRNVPIIRSTITLGEWGKRRGSGSYDLTGQDEDKLLTTNDFVLSTGQKVNFNFRSVPPINKGGYGTVYSIRNHPSLVCKVTESNNQMDSIISMGYEKKAANKANDILSGCAAKQFDYIATIHNPNEMLDYLG